MKFMSPVRLAAFSTMLAAGLMWANLPAIAEEGAPHHAEGQPPSTQPAVHRASPKDLEHAMERMGSAMKKLKKQIPDKEQTVAALETIKTMQADTFAAKSIMPGNINKLPAGEQAEARKDYLKMMSHALELQCTIEQSLLDEDLKGAQSAFDMMNDLMKEGHKEFKPKKEDHD